MVGRTFGAGPDLLAASPIHNSNCNSVSRRSNQRACPLARTTANQEWALDFLHDAVESGRAIRVLSVVDAYTRECLALDVVFR